MDGSGIGEADSLDVTMVDKPSSPKDPAMEPLRFPANKRSTQARVFDIIKARSFRRGKFTLVSGKTSDYYLDLKPTMFDPEGATLLATLILEHIAKIKVDCIGGLAMGAVPLIATVNVVSFTQNRPLPGFFVRKAVKDHGTRRRVEGSADLMGKSVVILDDVTTTGGSAMEAVSAAREAGAQVVLVLSVVDREEGATEFYQKEGIPFAALFTASEFLRG